MDLATARRKFYFQKWQAGRRGIEWQLTFQEWVDWWGADLDRRGRRTDELCMQRVADTGPYSLENIRKGHPRENRRTAGKMRRKRGCERIEASLDALRDINPPTYPWEPPDNLVDPETETISEYFARTSQMSALRYK